MPQIPDPDAMLFVEAIRRAGQTNDGDVALIDLVGFGADEPITRLSFDYKLIPTFFAALASANQQTAAARNKASGAAPGSMQPQPMLEVTGFQTGDAFDASFVPLKISTHTGADLLFQIPLVLAQELAKQLSAKIDQLQQKKPPRAN